MKNILILTALFLVICASAQAITYDECSRKIESFLKRKAQHLNGETMEYYRLVATVKSLSQNILADKIPVGGLNISKPPGQANLYFSKYQAKASSITVIFDKRSQIYAYRTTKNKQNKYICSGSFK